MIPYEEYTALVRYRLQNPLPNDVYGEVHHIVPKCCGGLHLEDNVIKLTPEEHFKAHLLLPLIYKHGREKHCLDITVFLMSHSRDGLSISAETYGELRRKFALSRKEILKEYWGHIPFSIRRKRASKMWRKSKKPIIGKFSGKHHTEEVKRKIGMAGKGRTHSQEMKQYLSFIRKGKRAHNKGKILGSHSEEWNRKISESIKRKFLSDDYRKRLSDAAKRRWSKKKQEHNNEN